MHKIVVSERSDVLTRFSRFYNWLKMKKEYSALISKSTERKLPSKTSTKGARNESKMNLKPLRVTAGGGSHPPADAKLRVSLCI